MEEMESGAAVLSLRLSNDTAAIVTGIVPRFETEIREIEKAHVSQETRAEN